MAATLQSLFPLHDQPGRKYTVYPCVAEFSAPIENGNYIFSRSTTPPVKFGRLLQGQTGVIAGVLVSANCADADFTKALNGSLKLQIMHGGNKTPVNMAPFAFPNFAAGDNFQEQWEITGTTTQQDEDFYLAIEGTVQQIDEMTEDRLLLKIAFNFIRYDGQGL